VPQPYFLLFFIQFFSRKNGSANFLSVFTNRLSDLQWEQPRATAVSYASIIGFIFAARYLPLLRWAFKFLYMSLGGELVA
jgi:hypothetical protein